MLDLKIVRHPNIIQQSKRSSLMKIIYKKGRGRAYCRECGYVDFAVHLNDEKNGGMERAACVMISGLISLAKPERIILHRATVYSVCFSVGAIY